MLLSIANNLENMETVPRIIISIALILFIGFCMTRVTKLLKLPNVTAYIVVGILLGPYCFDVIPSSIVQSSDFMSDVATAFIAFGTGEYFKLSVLKKNAKKVIIITLFESLLAMILVFVLLFVILKLPLAFSAVIATIAAIISPTSTMMTIKQTKSKGDFVDTLLQVIALDDIIGLILLSIALSLAKSINDGMTLNFLGIIKPVATNLGVLVLGGLFGVLLKILMPVRRTTDNKLIIGVATLFFFCSICALIDVSPLLGCMSMGMVYINITNDDKFFKQMAYFSPPFLLFFFVRSGLNFNLSALVSNEQSINGVPLILIVVLYVIVRLVGKYVGSYAGCSVVKKDKLVRNYLGLALVPQGGVAIGLAALASRTLEGELGLSLQTVIIASSVLYELIGPASAKLSLYLSKSYSNDLDDNVNVSEVDDDGNKKSEVELLVEKINQIKDTLPKHEEISEEEQAFNEASMEQYANMMASRNKRNKWRN